MAYLRNKGPIVLGNDVWIGARAIIMPGITIGDGSAVGQACVVTNEVPPHAIAAGIPARLIRFRFSGDTIAAMQASSRWD